MKLSNMWKRAGAFVLSIAMVGAVCDGFVGEPLQAASPYKIEFKERVWEGEAPNLTTVTTAVAGCNVEIQTTKPASWTYSNPPFTFLYGGGNGTSQNLTGDANSEQIKIRPDLQSEVGNTVDRQVYTIRPNLSVQVNDGGGSMVYDSGSTASLTVKSAQPLSITENSSITFKTVQGQTGNGITFTPVSATTGSWKPFYDNAQIESSGITTAGNKLTFTVKVKPNIPGSEHQALNLEITLTAPRENFTIPAGATFTISYTMESIGELTLIAVTPKAALDRVETEMNNPTQPSETSRRKPYVQFANSGDTMDAVSGKFYLLNDFYKYNARMAIDWKPVGDAVDYISIAPQQGKDQALVSIGGELPELEKEITIQGEVSFKTVGVQSVPRMVTIKLTLMGKGASPIVTAKEQTRGINDPSDPGANSNGQVLITEAINAFPSTMGTYDGSIPHSASPADQRTWPPFSVRTEFGFGSAAARATHVKVSATSANGGKIEFREGYAPNGSLLDATGVTVQNASSGSTPSTMRATFVGKQEGLVNLKIEFLNATGSIANRTFRVQVKDYVPKSDAALKQVDAKVACDPAATDDQKEVFNALYPNGTLDLNFTFDMLSYNISVPDAVDTVDLRPVYEKLSEWGANQKIAISVTPPPASPIPAEINSGEWTTPIPLTPLATTKITLNTKAEDGSQMAYTFNITRSSKSMDATLKDIVITKNDANGETVTLTPRFSPTEFSYTAEVPYTVDKVNVKAIANDIWASKPEITSNGPTTNFFLRMFEKASNKPVALKYDVDPVTQQIDNVTEITITVKPEDQTNPPQIYKINITRTPPDNENRIKTLTLRNRAGDTIADFNGSGSDPSQRLFYATVPYSTDLLTLDLLPESRLATAVTVEASAGSNRSQTKPYVNKDTPLSFSFSGLGQSATPDPALNEITYTIWAEAESGNKTAPPYQLILTRAPPDTSTTLLGLTVANEAATPPVNGFVFIPTKREYSFSVEYAIETVVVTPTMPTGSLAKMYVDGRLISSNMPNRTVNLTAGSVTKIVVRIVPESGEADAGTYLLNITRTKPSNETRLMNLVVNGGTDQKPNPFVPATTSYNWSIPEGVKDFTVTATPVDPKATIMVDGQTAPNGAPSNKILSTTANSTVTVVVTAEDGKTTKTYTLKIANYNYMKKSTNADLSALRLNHGQLAPAFNPTVEEYEVYVKPTAMSLAITPRTANAKATVEVKQGNRVVSKFDGAHTASLLEDETVFTITVTAEDTKTTKTYILNVYRNDEEKEGVFAPISPDMVDFESSDPIIIDIATYPVVDALVFNTLKTEYPDKTILFKGNDYTLELKGSDMDTLVPHTATFDLAFSFTTPEETAIENLLYDMGTRNDTLEPVYVYFDHHGTLPAPMLLTVSLGKEYSNETIYWNYYNKERDRIDYYGYVNTNAKGTFSVPIDHFSTYFITISRVLGAENKSGLDYSSIPWMEEIGVETPTQKVNPNTGGKQATPPVSGGTR